MRDPQTDILLEVSYRDGYYTSVDRELHTLAKTRGVGSGYDLINKTRDIVFKYSNRDQLRLAKKRFETYKKHNPGLNLSYREFIDG